MEDGRGGGRASRLLTQKCGSCRRISSMLSRGLMPWSHYTVSCLVIGSLAHNVTDQLRRESHITNQTCEM